MKAHLQIFVTAALVVLLAGAASAYDYGFDPNKAPLGGNNDMYMELAQNPVLISGGVYDGKIEYFFDCYNIDTTFYFLHIVGLDNSKILNAPQARPGPPVGAPDTVRTQRWGDPDGNYEAWPTATGRIFDFWSKDVNASQVNAQAFDKWRSSYDDGAGGWTDSGLAIVEPATNNPHSYGEYVEHSGTGADMWKAELTGPGQPLHWWNTQFGIDPAQDVIYMAGATVWSPGSAGLVWTVRVVYDEEIDPLTIGWGGNATAEYDILGDFTVVPEPVTLSLLGLGGLALLRRRKK